MVHIAPGKMPGAGKVVIFVTEDAVVPGGQQVDRQRDCGDGQQPTQSAPAVRPEIGAGVADRSALSS